MKRKVAILIILVVVGLILLGGWTAVQAMVISANTILTVNETSDLSDLNPGDGLCDASANAGDQCTLRAALEELNAQGPDVMPHRVEFDIIGTGPFTISPNSTLPDILVPMEIDGITQSGAACPTLNAPATLLIVLDGSNAGAGVDGLTIGSGAAGSTVQGLAVGNFSIHGIRITTDNNVLRCNHFGLGPDGVSAIGNNSAGAYVDGNNNLIGGQFAAQRNVFSANGGDGIRVASNNQGNFIGNNFVGTTADGMEALGNSGGIYISGDNNFVGGTAPLLHNTLSGNVGYGLRLNSGSGNVILGNLFGLARDGSSPLPNGSDGLQILGGSITNTIGGTAPDEANIIVNNGGNGLALDENVGGIPSQNTIRGNSIYNNDLLGIDLGYNGVDINDPGDGDSGENSHQNYPVLTTTTGSELVTITLDSLANTEFIVDIYRNVNCDGSGYGEGQEHLTTGVIMTDGTGQVAVVIDLTGQVADGEALTATATDPDGNTSEFSACALISFPPPSPTPTSTSTPSSTPTATATSTGTATATSTGSITPEPSATPTASQTPTVTGTVTPTPTGTIDPDPSITPPPKPTLTGTPTGGGEFFIYLPLTLR